MKLQYNGSLLASLSDSNNSIFAIITQECISSYEREHHCRITEYTTNCLVLIRKIKLRWLTPGQFRSMFGNLINRYPNVYLFAILEIDEIELFDADQTEYLIQLESVYTTQEYRDKIKPYQIQQDELQCL